MQAPLDQHDQPPLPPPQLAKLLINFRADRGSPHPDFQELKVQLRVMSTPNWCLDPKYTVHMVHSVTWSVTDREMPSHQFMRHIPVLAHRRSPQEARIGIVMQDEESGGCTSTRYYLYNRAKAFTDCELNSKEKGPFREYRIGTRVLVRALRIHYPTFSRFLPSPPPPAGSNTS